MRVAGWLMAAVIMGWGSLSLPAGASAACGPAKPSQALLAARTALQQAGVKHEDMDTDVSVGERAALHAFKQALADAVDQRMACLPASADAAVLENDLAAALGAVPVEKAQMPGDNDPVFGSSLTIGVGGNAARPDLILIQVGFSILCGDDTVLVGYRVENRQWRRVLRWQSDDYDSISGAFGSPFNAVTLSGGQVVAVHGTPWCTSVWSKFGLDVLKPAEASAPERLLDHLEHSYRRDEGLALTAKPDGFELRAQVGMLDTDILARQGIFRYRMSGDQIERIQPAARNGRDFVDEWLQVDDAQARAWSDPTAVSAIAKARADVLASKPSPSYGAVHACKGQPRHFQVEIDLGDGGPDRQRYALLRQEANGFTMLHFGTAADPACKGPDLMKH